MASEGSIAATFSGSCSFIYFGRGGGNSVSARSLVGGDLLIIISAVDLSVFFTLLLVSSDNSSSLLGVGGWDNLGVSWESELLDQVLNSLVSQEII